MSLTFVPRALQYFEQVAQLGSIQAASRESGISASAIHRQITAMEDALGEQLFERETRGMKLTPTGHHILELARDWRLDNARLWSTVQADRGVEQGQVRIAAMDGMVNGFVPKLLEKLAADFPRVQIDVEIMSPENATKGILNGDVDIAAVMNVEPNDNLEFHWSREYPLGYISVADHPIAQETGVTLRNVIAHPVVLQSKALSIRKLLEAHHGWIFEEAKQAVVVNSIQLMKQLVLSGQYVAITSELDAGPEILSGALNFRPIVGRGLFHQRFSIISNVLIPKTNVIEKIVADAIEMLGGEVVSTTRG